MTRVQHLRTQLRHAEAELRHAAHGVERPTVDHFFHYVGNVGSIDETMQAVRNEVKLERLFRQWIDHYDFHDLLDGRDLSPAGEDMFTDSAYRIYEAMKVVASELFR